MEQPVFKRSYRACIHCRTRKIRCNLGDLEHPSKPPCLRCRREGRQCIFAESRRGGNRRVKGTGQQQRDGDITINGATPKSPLSCYDGSQSSTEGLNSVDMMGSSQESAIREHELHNTHDAMDILVHVARSMPPAEYSCQPGRDEPRKCQHLSVTNNSPPAKSPLKQPSKQRKQLTLSESDPVREGYVNEADAKVLINFFWESLQPFYPFVPQFLRQIEELVFYRTLLWTILTISARYYSLSLPSEIQHDGGALHGGLHDRLWERTNRELGRFCVSTGKSYWNVGTVMAFLLFTEWNPRAIHYPQNPANEELEDDDIEEDKGGVTNYTGGWSASRTSCRMAWLMVSMAIRMAVELDVFSYYPEIYVGIYVCELDVAVRQGSHCTSATLLPALQLPIDGEQRSLIRLLEIRSLAQQALYKSRANTRQILEDGSYISFLNLFSNHLNSWFENNQSCLKGHSLSRESNLLEYHYTRLYIYSLALSPSNFNDAIKAIRFMEYATRAAHECVRVVLRVHDMGYFARAPVRWFIRVVHSAVFIVKAHLLTPKMQGGQETIDILKRLVNVLKEASPDEVHLASRYSHILDQICKNIFRQRYMSSGSCYSDQVSDIKGALSPIPVLSQTSTTFGQDEQSLSPESQSKTEAGNTAYWKDDYHKKSCIESSSSHPGDRYLQLTTESSIDAFGDFSFDFLTEGSEGLGFVDRLMADFDQHPSPTDDISGAVL